MNKFTRLSSISQKCFYLLFLISGIIWITSCSDSSKIDAKQELRRQQSVLKGKELYLSHGCAVCHGKEGHGDGMTAKYFYPKPIDLHDPEAYVQGNTITAITSSIKNGIRRENSAMPNYEHLTSEELNHIAQYLKSLQVKPEKAE